MPKTGHGVKRNGAGNVDAGKFSNWVEEGVLFFWDKNKIFEKSVERRKPDFAGEHNGAGQILNANCPTLFTRH